MRPFSLAVAIAAGIATLASLGLAQQAPTPGPYKVVKKVKVGGEGGFDYIFADVKGRRLYTPRGGTKGHLAVFNLETLEPQEKLKTSAPAAPRLILNRTTASRPPSRSRCGTRQL